MAVLPEKILAQGINSEVVPVKIKSESLGGAKGAKRLQFCKKGPDFWFINQKIHLLSLLMLLS